MRTLGLAFLKAGQRRGIDSFIEAGDGLMDASARLDSDQITTIQKSRKWMLESLVLALIGVSIAILLGRLAGDYWSAAWGMSPIILLFAWTPWALESSRRKKAERDAFHHLQQLRKMRD